jgi:branched-chain amino acid transport system ATP-binding protein
MSMTTVLSAEDLHLSYGPINAVRGCTFHLDEGETIAVIGANGAGKTTIMRGLSNLLAPKSGTITFLGQPIARRKTSDLARAGMLHIPEGRGTIGGLTVLENLHLAFDVRPARVEFNVALDPVFGRFPRLAERKSQRAGSLSGGEQQMLALARALINPPRVLLVDEPSLGLSPVMVKEAYASLREFRADGMSIMLVEQNVRMALRLADRTYVLRQGKIVLEGTSQELLSKPEVLDAYLGSQ